MDVPLAQRIKEFQTALDFELPTVVEEDEIEPIEVNFSEHSGYDESERSSSNSISTKVPSPGSSQDTSFGNTTSEVSTPSSDVSQVSSTTLSTLSSKSGKSRKNMEVETKTSKFNAFHAPFTSHLGLVSKKKAANRSSSLGNCKTTNDSADKIYSAKTLPNKIDFNSIIGEERAAFFHSLSKDATSQSIENDSFRDKTVSESNENHAENEGCSESASESADEHLARLEKELENAKVTISEKEKKCASLLKLQSVVDNEVQELTETLFQEAYKMVNSAEERKERAERLLAEARLKLDLLQAEVSALKGAMKDMGSATSTPKRSSKGSIAQRFLSNSANKSSDSLTPPSTKKSNLFSASKSAQKLQSTQLNPRPAETNEIDPIYYKEFATWRENAEGLDETSSFLSRIFREDIEPCLVFENNELTSQVLQAIKDNTLEMEPINREHGCNTRDCSLLRVKKQCPYQLRTSSDTDWQFISLLARNRIAAVCDFFTYLRYVKLGIIKPSMNESYWNIINLRKNMTLAKLGLHFNLKMNGSSSCNSLSNDCDY
ncbi:GDP/GTP exchange factor sec2p domain-containing protein [Ditylenchus destructor]|nr:GDP/GTP exchange factor sec2p domain-containing protein [Ditylenchus destructor]